MVFALLDRVVGSEVETGDPEGVDDILSVEQCRFTFFVGVWRCSSLRKFECVLNSSLNIF